MNWEKVETKEQVKDSGVRDLILEMLEVGFDVGWTGDGYLRFMRKKRGKDPEIYIVAYGNGYNIRQVSRLWRNKFLTGMARRTEPIAISKFKIPV